MCLWCCWFRSEERHTVVEEENCSVDVVVAPHMTVTMFWFSEKKKKKQKKNLAPPQTFPLLLCFCDDVTVVRALVSFCKDVYFHYCVCNFVVGKRGMKMRRLEIKKTRTHTETGEWKEWGLMWLQYCSYSEPEPEPEPEPDSWVPVSDSHHWLLHSKELDQINVWRKKKKKTWCVSNTSPQLSPAGGSSSQSMMSFIYDDLMLGL